MMADVAADIAGPNVVFHHSKLNFKWFDASDTVKWHQDIQFFPHTNYNVFTIGCYLADTTMENGPLAVLPGSHEGELFDLYGADGAWAGCLNDRDASSVDMSRAFRVARTDLGSKRAHSRRMSRDSSETSESPPPMTPAMATGTEASQMASMPSWRVRSSPSRVRIFSPSRALRTWMVDPPSFSRSKAWRGWPS